MSPPIDPKTVKALSSGPRWSALVRGDEPLISVSSWDKGLMRQTRVLVPIDVQALYVPQDNDETYVRLPFATTTPDGADPEPMPAPFQDGEKRKTGVHLHWAMPDSLLNGQMTDRDPGAENRLSLPPLPDRWAVLRLLVPRDGERAAVTGWIIEADTTKITALADWPQPDKARAPTGKVIPPASLTGTVGGTLNWSGIYDAVTNRFAFHDPLTDLPTAGVLGDFAAYLICGWWSQPSLDPLDISGAAGLQAKLADLRWRLTDDLDDRGSHAAKREAKLAGQAAVKLTSKPRHQAFAFDAKTEPARVEPTAAAAIGGLFAETAAQFGGAVAHDPYSSLLNGVVFGVPVAGKIVTDQRPAGDEILLAFGKHSDDVAAVFAAAGLAIAKPEDRRDVERLISGFTHDLLAGMTTSNGLFAVEESEHASAFSSRPGEPGPPERVLEPGSGAELRGTRAQRSALAGKRPDKFTAEIKAELFWSKSRKAKVAPHETDKLRLAREEADKGKTPKQAPASRFVRRPTPRYFEPLEPMLAVRGAKRSLRHRFDRYRSPDGRLQCRWPSQVANEIEGLVKGADLISEFPAGGMPPEVVRLVHNAIILDPYIASWRADRAAKAADLEVGPVRNRIFAETALRFTKDGTFSPGGVFAESELKPSAHREALAAAALNRFSMISGVDPDPAGVTAWSQPWVPLWLEWEVELDISDRLDGWKLSAVDLEMEDPTGGVARKVAGRSPLHTGVAATLGDAIDGWLAAEEERDTTNQGEIDEEAENQFAQIAAAMRGIDILAASFDSLHDQLLGLPVGPYGILQERSGADMIKPTPVNIPALLVSGRLRVARARIIDAFGRIVDLPAEKVLYPARDIVNGKAAMLRPRILRPARWLFRLGDAGDLTTTPREATIDQVEPSLMVNPVAGFLLPDHIDEALEAFDAAGNPLGQLFHDPISGGVAWEIAPGRDGPPDAGPLHGLSQAQQLLGLISGAVVAKDAEVRGGRAAKLEEDSALSALLRAIDTTLWTVDTYAVLGASHVAGLVGRPIAVVRATLRLDIARDIDELKFADIAQQVARQATYDALADRAFPVRLGELTRDDDGVLGFFVDDDFSRFHIVDKVVRDAAPDAGRGRGQLGPLGSSPPDAAVRPITHPYIVAEDELLVRPGQILRLTILMHPGGKCHLTSGILPRKSLQLSRDWIHAGLAAMAPSARVGPVLIDEDKVRLPLIASFGAEQLWTRREGNFTWKNDPILAATQTALLPDAPATVEEGYIRIATVTDAKQGK
jgi:hypothetical protein